LLEDQVEPRHALLDFGVVHPDDLVQVLVSEVLTHDAPTQVCITVREVPLA